MNATITAMAQSQTWKSKLRWKLFPEIMPTWPKWPEKAAPDEAKFISLQSNIRFTFWERVKILLFGKAQFHAYMLSEKDCGKIIHEVGNAQCNVPAPEWLRT